MFESEKIGSRDVFRILVSISSTFIPRIVGILEQQQSNRKRNAPKWGWRHLHTPQILEPVFRKIDKMALNCIYSRASLAS